MEMPVNDIIESARKAGHELIEKGKISYETSTNIKLHFYPVMNL